MKIDLKLKQSGYSLLMALLTLGVIIIINLVVTTLNIQFDMTDKGLFTLSKESIEVIEKLDGNVKILALYKQGAQNEQVLGVLEKYSSFRAIELKIVDPDRNPAMLLKYSSKGEVLSHGSLIVDNGKFWQIINESDLFNVDYSKATPEFYGSKVEQKVTSAINFVRNGRTLRVYEIFGHNETSIINTPIKGEMQLANFDLASLNITTSSGIPEDADILLIIGPQRDFTEYEVDKLTEFLKDDGKLFISLGYVADSMSNIKSLLSQWDIEYYNGLTMERDSKRLYSEFGDNPFLFAPLMPDNKINQYMRNSQTGPFFSASAGFNRTENKKRNLEFSNVLVTTEKSWLRTDIEKEDDLLLDSDIKGPVNVLVTVAELNTEEGYEEGTRVVASGSPTSFTPMGSMGILPGNIKLLIGSLLWLDNSDSFISIPSKSLYNKPLVIDTNRSFVYGFIVMVLIPLIIIITSIVIYFRRKNL